MKNRLRILIAGTLVVMLAACHSSNDSAGTTAPPTATPDAFTSQVSSVVSGSNAMSETAAPVVVSGITATASETALPVAVNTN